MARHFRGSASFCNRLLHCGNASHWTNQLSWFVLGRGFSARLPDRIPRRSTEVRWSPLYHEQAARPNESKPTFAARKSQPNRNISLWDFGNTRIATATRQYFLPSARIWIASCIGTRPKRVGIAFATARVSIARDAMRPGRRGRGSIGMTSGRISRPGRQTPNRRSRRFCDGLPPPIISMISSICSSL